MSSPTVANSIYFGGRGTSVTLEDAFWQGLKEIARRRRMKLPDLIRAIERQDSNLSSAILAASFLSYIIPITFIIVWSLAAYLIYSLCNRTFIKVETLVQENVEKNAEV